MRGYNPSEKPSFTANYTLAKLVEDVRCVVQSLSLQRRVILVGHDWGGIAAWGFARESPGKRERVVIIDAPHPVLFYREIAHPTQMRSSGYALFFQLPVISRFMLRAGSFALLRTRSLVQRCDLMLLYRHFVRPITRPEAIQGR